MCRCGIFCSNKEPEWSKFLCILFQNMEQSYDVYMCILFQNMATVYDKIWKIWIVSKYMSGSWWGVLYTTLCNKVCQWLTPGRWFSLGTPVSSTNKIDRHDITEIVLKVALNTIKFFNKMLYHDMQPKCSHHHLWLKIVLTDSFLY